MFVSLIVSLMLYNELAPSIYTSSTKQPLSSVGANTPLMSGSETQEWRFWLTKQRSILVIGGARRYMNKLFRRASIQTPPKLEREKVCVERQPAGEWVAQISAIGGQSSFVMLIVTLKEPPIRVSCLRKVSLTRNISINSASAGRELKVCRHARENPSSQFLRLPGKPVARHDGFLG